VAKHRGGAGLQLARSLFSAGSIGGLTDGQLLERFGSRRGEAAEVAFTALVERHGPMVLRVCRGVLDDPHDAHDAFQATFLVLVRRVGSIRKSESVASWLHGVAYRTASCARSAEARRRRHERRAAELATLSASEDPREDYGPLVHEELERLPGRYREPIVLCDLEGLTQEQAAHHLALPVGTIKSRLSRGRERLRDRLRRRGLAPTIGALAAGLVEGTASAAVPSRLVESAVHAAMWFAAGDLSATGTVPAAVSVLMEGVLRSMFTGKLKSVAGTFAVGLVVACAGFLAAQAVASGQPAIEPSNGQPVNRPDNKERPRSKTFLKIYYVGDFLTISEAPGGKGPSVQSKDDMRPLMKLIASSTAHGTWQVFDEMGKDMLGPLGVDVAVGPGKGPIGSITPFFPSISLMIRHTAEVHAEVAERLRQLRSLPALQGRRMLERDPSKVPVTYPQDRELASESRAKRVQRLTSELNREIEALLREAGQSPPAH
jgi:RNA polymerase sigma factor (sigma-70 family)